MNEPREDAAGALPKAYDRHIAALRLVKGHLRSLAHTSFGGGERPSTPVYKRRMNRLRLDRVLLAVIVIVGLWLTRGHGLSGFLVFIAAAAVLGAVVGLVGRRYPMIYQQNRRDRRRAMR